MEGRFTRVAVVLVAAAVGSATAAAGCGQGEEEKFKEEFGTINGRIIKTGEDLGGALVRALEFAQVRSNTEVGREFTGFAKDLAAIRRDLEELEPPQDARGDLDALSEALRREESRVRTLARVIRKGDSRQTAKAVRAVRRGARKIRVPRLELAKATGAKRD
jgi:hypothetical protein